MNENKGTILIIEDDAQIRKFIKYSLSKEGYKTIESGYAKSGLAQLISEKIDLIILDLGLPDMDGLEVIQKVREWSEIPIIVVSARDQDKEKVTALDSGADDYLTKPFSAPELLARIRVALRYLLRRGSTALQSSYEVGDLLLDYDKRLLFLKGEEVHLTPNEYNLLVLLAKNGGKVITTKMIIQEIWGVHYGNDTQALRALMAGLRRKIEEVPGKPRYILTEIGVGYRLVDE